MLDWKTAALMFSWLMLVRLGKGIPRVEEGLVKGIPWVGETKGDKDKEVKGIPRVEEVKEVGLSSWQLAPDCWLACALLGLPRRWFEYFIGTSLTVLSVH